MTTDTTHPRRPGLALALSALLPGLGQLYNGQLNKGLLLFIAFAFVSTPFIALVALWLPAGWLLPLLLLALISTLGLYLYGLADAWRGARRSTGYRLRDWQQPGVYLALLLFGYLVVLAGSTDYLRGNLVESFRIPSASMEPGVLPGDFLFADKRVNCPGCKHRLRHGDVAVFVYPNDRTLYYIKRVVGLPGDEIRITDREVFVNGASIRRSVDAGAAVETGAQGDYPVNWAQGESEPRSWRVPQGEVFVLGDNRNATRDSRELGTIPLRDVVGRANQVWFSYDRETGVRWERLGRVIY